MSFEHLYALGFFPLALLALILLQFYRSRRREILAGSLLLWRRVAAKETAPRKRRLLWDRYFWLEVGVLGALTLALTGPALAVFAPPGRRVAMLLDNGPAARARMANGGRVWEDVLAAANETLSRLGPADRVALSASAPFPRRLDAGSEGQGMTPGEARSAAEALVPALSGPTSAAAKFALLEAAREFGGAEGPALALAFSPRAAPDAESGPARARWRRVGSGVPLENTALTAFGSALTLRDGQAAAEILVQVRSFSTSTGVVRGRLVLETQGGAPPRREERPLTLAAAGPLGAVSSATFLLAGKDLPPVKISWVAQRGPDALPEDDVLCARPRSISPLKVRLHGSAPHLERLYREALGAGVSKPGATDDPDLEIYVDHVPEELPAHTRAALFLAPASGFGSFEVTPRVFTPNSVHPGRADPLLEGLHDTPTGLGFAIGQARELRATGDLQLLLRDEAGHPLAARFRIRGGCTGYVLAFVPGAELTSQRQMPLAALLLRILREAAGSVEPYAVQKAGEIEKASGVALPLDWAPGMNSALNPHAGSGVLDLDASDLASSLGAPAGEALDLESWLPAARPATFALWPWLVGLALLLVLLEQGLERSQVAKNLNA